MFSQPVLEKAEHHRAQDLEPSAPHCLWGKAENPYVDGEAEFHLSVLNYIMEELKLLFFIHMLRLSQGAASRIPVLFPCDPVALQELPV